MAAPTAQTFVGDIDIGTYLKIYSTGGVYNNLSDSSDMWKFFLKLKARDPGGRELRYNVRKSYGPASMQALGAGTSGDYPAGQRTEMEEAIAQYKDYGLTVNVPRNLLNKTGDDLLQYADPLNSELDAKSIVAARLMSGMTQRDGSGSIGVVASVTASTGGDSVAVVLSTTTGNAGKSHVGWFEENDKVKFAAQASTAHATINNTATAVSYWKVSDIDEDADTVTLQPYDSSDALIDVTSATLGATDPTAADSIYRFGTTPNDLTGITTEDYNTLSQEMVGLESLTADDGRKVNGLTHSNALKGTRLDASAAQIDSSHFQKILSKAKRRCGRNRYQWKNAFMYDSVYDALIEQSETDRRFQTIEDGSRGFKKLGYQHGKDFVEFSPDEFVSKQRIWMPPESKEVIEFHGKDFEIVEVNPGQKFHLSNSTTAGNSGHTREQQCYMEGAGVITVKHAAAIPCIENFTAA